MKTKKIVVTLEIDVDRDAWDLTYGTGFMRHSDFKEDVRSYVLGLVHGSAAAEEKCITYANGRD